MASIELAAKQYMDDEDIWPSEDSEEGINHGEASATEGSVEASRNDVLPQEHQSRVSPSEDIERDSSEEEVCGQLFSRERSQVHQACEDENKKEIELGDSIGIAEKHANV